MNGVDTRLKTLIQESVEKWQQEFVEVEIMADHVHLLVDVTHNLAFIGW